MLDHSHADRSGNILYNRGIAFVTYEHDGNASFAKEAMANQSLDMEEVLNVRSVIFSAPLAELTS